MIVLGFGFRHQAPYADFVHMIETMQALHPTHVATIERKANHKGFVDAARAFNLPIIRVSQAALARQKTVTHSEKSMALFATGSLSEAVALAAAGSNAYLLKARHVSPTKAVTCAAAKGIEE